MSDVSVPLAKHPGVFHLKSWAFPMAFYSLLIFLVCLADGIMSYVTPVYIEEYVHNPLLMGVIMSFSSVVGIICDFVFSKKFNGRSYSFFLFQTTIFGALAALSYLIYSPHAAMLLMVVGLWGVYYELLQFSNFHFVHTFVAQEKHGTAWAILMSTKGQALIVAPLLASYLIANSEQPAFWVMLMLHCVVIGLLWVFTRIRPAHHRAAKEVQKHSPVQKRTFFGELKIWRTLFQRTWPIYMFVFSLSILDSAYWTVGALLSEEMPAPYTGMLLALSALPTVFTGLVANRWAVTFGKKRTAFMAGLIGSVGLVGAGMMTQPVPMLILIFISSCFTSSAWPMVLAAYEDYVARLGKYGNDMVGLESSSNSLSYIIGPILCGAIASWVGYHLTFSVIGVLLGAMSIVALVFTPRKIKMPQAELEQQVQGS